MRLFYMLILCLFTLDAQAEKIEYIPIMYGSNDVHINEDLSKDMIVKFRVNLENAHSYDKYILLLKNENSYSEILISNKLETIEGADCMLSDYRFYFDKEFYIVEYKRNVGLSYYSKEYVYKNTYKLKLNDLDQYELILDSSTKLPGKHCDIKNLID